MSIKALLIYEFAFTKLAFIIYNQEYQLNLQATGNDTCVISRCVRYDIIFIRDQVWSRIKTSNPRENPQDFLGVIKINPVIVPQVKDGCR